MKLWLLVCCCVVATACVEVRTLDRGALIPYAELHERRDTLPELVVDSIRSGQTARAFYALEVHKSRRFASLLSREAKSRDITGRYAVEALKDASGKPTRGLKLVPAQGGSTRPAPSPEARQRPSSAADDRAFWQEQKQLEEVTEAMRKRALFYEMTLRDRYIVTTAREVQLAVKAEQLLLSFFVGREDVYAFAVTQSGFRVAKLGKTPSLRGLATAVIERVRDRTSTDWQPRAAALRKALLGPFASEVAAAKHITIVPDGFISNVPFAVLTDGKGVPLLEQVRIGYMPSASFHRALMQRSLRSPSPRMLAVGNPTYPVPASPLLAAEDEARVVFSVFERSALLTGAQAQERRFYDLYPDYNVYHFATHGVLGGEGAVDASSLLLAPGADDDGFLTAAEISRLDLKHSYLAVLSACETAVSSDDSQSLDSISAAFLAAGTPSIVGSQWSVSDRSTAVLMTSFYPRFLDLGAGEALRQAQLALRKKKAFSHPFHWAAFVLYGGDS